jgi:hypothetical protein
MRLSMPCRPTARPRRFHRQFVGAGREKQMTIDQTNLAPNERPRQSFRYVVEGVGEFPLDMLRYDNAWPATTLDVASMATESLFNATLRRQVVIHSYRAPTLARWESFGWRVRVEDVRDAFVAGRTARR